VREDIKELSRKLIEYLEGLDSEDALPDYFELQDVQIISESQYLLRYWAYYNNDHVFENLNEPEVYIAEECHLVTFGDEGEITGHDLEESTIYTYLLNRDQISSEHYDFIRKVILNQCMDFSDVIEEVNIDRIADARLRKDILDNFTG
jgi:hypothetical protein